MNSSPKQYLGLDLGRARLGVARGSAVARIAEPLETIELDKAGQELPIIVRQTGAEALVIGVARGLVGTETEQTKWARQQGTKIGKELGLPVFWQDEALTTQLAEKQAISPAGADAHAAAIILQDFLDSPGVKR